MAKLKGPLFSLGAAGQIGKALVYFNWKGLNVVREHVVPSNPKTDGQQTQRGYMTLANFIIHAEQGRAVNPIASTDISAYALLASVVKSATTWFNQACKIIIDQFVASKIAVLWGGGTLTPAATQITLKIQDYPYDAVGPTNSEVYWGTSKTALIHKQAVTKAQLNGGVAITGMVAKTKYFLQVRPTVHVNTKGSNSGIYHATTT